MKAVMYHYVRPDPANMPWFRHLRLADFHRQLDYFTEAHGFVERSEFLEVLDGKPAPSGKILLTFDDGFKDHARFVLPELAKRGFWGMFYVNSGVIAEGGMLDVHRVHCLLGRHGGRKMLAAIEPMVADGMLAHEHVEEFNTRTYQRQDNDEATRRFKRILNYFLAYEWRKPILDRLVAAHLDQGAIAQDYYCDSDDLARLQEAGMMVGNHTVNHVLMSLLDADVQEGEIRDCADFIDGAVGGVAVKTYAHPYGGFHSFNDDTVRLLDEQGYRFSFNVEPRDIEAADLRKKAQFLPRYDCNQFPHGQCPPVPD